MVDVYLVFITKYDLKKNQWSVSVILDKGYKVRLQM